ncbi:DUF3626 domain-containing protein [Photobacterium damselae]|uniref:DUF3626 domain-containing protein n=1 Tax=Photobacterium damselae TaxID=38293 RepID=UPI001EFEB1F4|nr:DUF3626 domain-containing protein [Photobacterium damselae]MCG9780723.1 DUF3626 domain-containing protein [Photobacterium damselae]
MNQARNIIEQVLKNIQSKSLGEAHSLNCAVTINFHPDRFTVNNVSLLQAIGNDRLLKSQFETGTSNGGLTAYTGGERWLWEQRVFDGAYDNVPNNLRPKYGALNFRNYETGASPRFGSSYFQLKTHTLQRTTFCFPDSFFEPEDFATSNHIKHLIDLASSSNTDYLDNYIEAHIHGPLSLDDDIECIVLDPIYRSTNIEKSALKLRLPIKWHNGYELSLREMSLYPDYRGQQFIELAKEIAQRGKINARILGLAVTEKGYDELDVKKIWHYLARFGYQTVRHT